MEKKNMQVTFGQLIHLTRTNLITKLKAPPFNPALYSLKITQIKSQKGLLFNQILQNNISTFQKFQSTESIKLEP